MADAGKTNDYHDAAVALFKELQGSRYRYDATKALPTAIDDEAKLLAHLNSGGAAEAFRDLGGTRERVKFEYQLLAASNPTAYAALKLAEMTKIEDETKRAFTSAFDRFLGSGYSREAARQMALIAAGNVKQQETVAMNMAFGEQDAAIFRKALSHESSKNISPVAEAVAHHGPGAHRIEHSGHKKHKKRKHKKQAAITVD